MTTRTRFPLFDLSTARFRGGQPGPELTSEPDAFGRADQLPTLNWLYNHFRGWLYDVLRGTELIGADGKSSRNRRFEIFPTEQTVDQELLRLWNERGGRWILAHDPELHAQTMLTIFQFLLMSQTQSPERWLSLGAGPGIYETFLATILQSTKPSGGPEIVAVDLAEAMVNFHKELIAHTRAVDLPLDNLVNLKADAEHLPVKDHSIDQIYAIDLFQWLPRWPAVVTEMARVMNPETSARLFFSVDRKPFRGRGIGRRAWYGFGNFGLETFLDTLEAKGFALTRSRQLMSQPPAGKKEPKLNRLFFLAQFAPGESHESWRTQPQISANLMILARHDSTDESEIEPQAPD